MHQKGNWQNAPLCAGLMGQTTKRPLQFRVQIKKTASLLDILSRPQVVFMFQDHKSSADICTPTYNYTATQIASRIISNHSKHHSKIKPSENVSTHFGYLALSKSQLAFFCLNSVLSILEKCSKANSKALPF